MDQQIAFVVDRFNSMLEGDGATIQVDSMADGILRLKYATGPDGECEACVLNPEDLEALIGEALAGQVRSVEVVR
jgi:Fe-S cluster biogenesis protein NfuA